MSASTAPVKVTPAAGSALGVLRIALGFVFLWPFLDKAFGLGYATAPGKAWINGESPTAGFLKFATQGKPLAGFFQSLPTALSDIGFMLGMLAIGTALILGIGTRLAALGGAIMMGMLYLATMPFITSPEAPSQNPLVDNHVIYAIAVVALAAVGAGNYLGLGKWWSSLDIVKKNPWLI